MGQHACLVLAVILWLSGLAVPGCVCSSSERMSPPSAPPAVSDDPADTRTRAPGDDLGTYRGRSFHYWLTRYEARDARRRAVKALGFQGASAIPELTAALSDPDWAVRAEAAYALGCMGPRAWSAVPRLRSLRHDPVEHVRNAASCALNKIAPTPRRRGSVEL